MRDNAAIKAVVNYCVEHHLDETLYLNFIEALRLPPSYLHLRLVAETLKLEYQRALRFVWLASEQRFSTEKEMVSNIAKALESTQRHSDNFHGLTEGNQLAALLLHPHPETSGLISEIYAALTIFAIRYSMQLLDQEDKGLKTLSNIIKGFRPRLYKAKS